MDFYGEKNADLMKIAEDFKKKIKDDPEDLSHVKVFTVYGEKLGDVHTIKIIDGNTVIINKGGIY